MSLEARRTELHGHQKTEKHDKVTENGQNKRTDSTDHAPLHECDDLSQLISRRESFSGDLIGYVIKKKLHEQNEKGVCGLLYDLWLASRNNTKLYQAVKNNGKLDAMLRHPDSQNRDTKIMVLTQSQIQGAFELFIFSLSATKVSRFIFFIAFVVLSTII